LLAEDFGAAEELVEGQQHAFVPRVLCKPISRRMLDNRFGNDGLMHTAVRA
jgi:hypothetical protein